MPSPAQMTARRAAGLCLECGIGPADEGRSKCSLCRQRARHAAAARRLLAAEKNVCEACLRRPRWRGQSRCKTCRDRYLPGQLERNRQRRLTTPPDP